MDERTLFRIALGLDDPWEVEEHGGDALKITDFSIDMSKAFIKGIAEKFENAAITFDKFHVIKIINDAVDKVRRAEQTLCPELKRTRYVME